MTITILLLVKTSILQLSSIVVQNRRIRSITVAQYETTVHWLYIVNNCCTLYKKCTKQFQLHTPLLHLSKPLLGVGCQASPFIFSVTDPPPAAKLNLMVYFYNTNDCDQLLYRCF